MEKYQCKRCDKSFDSYESLRRHVGRIHKIHSTNFFVEFNLNGKWPTCKCGCGRDVQWSAENKRFNEYIRGHASRVNNNWGHNQSVIEKSAETRRLQFARGERTTWNSGKTKETDDRILDNGMSTSVGIMSSQAERTNRSIKMSNQWKSENIVPLFGKDHSQWKGGISPINLMCRGDKRMYNEWTYPILVRDKFTCTRCGSMIDLQVHHDKERFSEILKRLITMEDLEKKDDFNHKKLICEKVTNYHINNQVSGVTLCFDCHKKIHPSLNLT